jgi:hypothetical protein
MPLPVKVSDELLALAKEEARGAHRSATAQIEHWATLGRAVEAMLAYGEMLALKRVGQTLPIPPVVSREDLHDLLAGLAAGPDRERVKARIRASGLPLYAADSEHEGMIVEVRSDGTRTPGHLKDRRFVPARRKPAARRT